MSSKREHATYNDPEYRPPTKPPVGRKTKPELPKVMIASEPEPVSPSVEESVKKADEIRRKDEEKLKQVREKARESAKAFVVRKKAEDEEKKVQEEHISEILGRIKTTSPTEEPEEFTRIKKADAQKKLEAAARTTETAKKAKNVVETAAKDFARKKKEAEERLELTLLLPKIEAAKETLGQRNAEAIWDEVMPSLWTRSWTDAGEFSEEDEINKKKAANLATEYVLNVAQIIEEHPGDLAEQKSAVAKLNRNYAQYGLTPNYDPLTRTGGSRPLESHTLARGNQARAEMEKRSARSTGATQRQSATPRVRVAARTAEPGPDAFTVVHAQEEPKKSTRKKESFEKSLGRTAKDFLREAAIPPITSARILEQRELEKQHGVQLEPHEFTDVEKFEQSLESGRTQEEPALDLGETELMLKHGFNAEGAEKIRQTIASDAELTSLQQQLDALTSDRVAAARDKRSHRGIDRKIKDAETKMLARYEHVIATSETQPTAEQEEKERAEFKALGERRNALLAANEQLTAQRFELLSQTPINQQELARINGILNETVAQLHELEETFGKVAIPSESKPPVMDRVRGWFRRVFGGGSSENTKSPEKKEQKKEASSTTIASESHPDRNEDNLVVDKQEKVYAVFDGVSNPPGGEVASEAASDYLKAHATELNGEDVESVKASMEKLLLDAASHVTQTANEAGKAGVSTTASIVKMLEQGDKRTAVIGNVGDSRVYVLRGSQRLEQITVDDSQVFVDLASTFSADQLHAMQRIMNRLPTIDEKSIKELKAHGLDEQAQKIGLTQDDIDLLQDKMASTALIYAFNRRNVIGNALKEGSTTPRVSTAELGPNDELIITSDGIHDNLLDWEIEAILSNNVDKLDSTLAATIASEKDPSRRLALAAQMRSRENSDRSKPDDMTAVVIG